MLSVNYRTKVLEQQTSRWIKRREEGIAKQSTQYLGFIDKQWRRIYTDADHYYVVINGKWREINKPH